MIDYIVLSNTKTAKEYEMTSNLVQSLLDTLYPAGNGFNKYRITIVETNTGINKDFAYPDCCNTVYFDMLKYGMFNYNYALNIGYSQCLQSYGDTDWFCALNNDVVCEPDWLQEISKAVTADPRIESVSPNPRGRADGIIYGYTLFKHLDGCCILHRRSVLDKIGMWDEAFDFAYQDDDYLERCRRAGVVHARVMSSIIHHIGNVTVNYTTDLAMRGFRRFADKWSYGVLMSREAEKNKYRREIEAGNR